MMDVQKAAKIMLKAIEARKFPAEREATKFPAERDASGKSKEHAVWMLAGISTGYIDHEKAHRWLGYAQGLLVGHGILDLQRCKEINNASEMSEQ